VVAEPGGRIARRLALGQACRHALNHAVHARFKEERTREPACRVRMRVCDQGMGMKRREAQWYLCLPVEGLMTRWRVDL
jgi:hypothetical protein